MLPTRCSILLYARLCDTLRVWNLVSAEPRGSRTDTRFTRPSVARFPPAFSSLTTATISRRSRRFSARRICSTTAARNGYLPTNVAAIFIINIVLLFGTRPLSPCHCNRFRCLKRFNDIVYYCVLYRFIYSVHPFVYSTVMRFHYCQLIALLWIINFIHNTRRRYCYRIENHENHNTITVRACTFFFIF